MLVKEILESTSTVLLITRPRRWGKSLNMDMVEKFFTIEVDKGGNPLPEEERINHKLFAGGQDAMNTQGQFPVISISIYDL